MSKVQTSKTLAEILDDTRAEISQDRAREPLSELKRRLSSAPKVNSFYGALNQPGYGLIGEIKECSPSKGPMLAENVALAAEVYRNSKHIRAISVLTNRTHFGENMTLPHLLEVKKKTGKPILRKDFIFDEYQVYQARAYGADAILLMANILKHQQLRRLHQVATQLGLDVLFETHEPSELRKIPDSAKIYGINSRNFCSEKYLHSRWLGCLKFLGLGKTDLTTDFDRFAYCSQLPVDAIRVAESGVSPENCASLFKSGFNAILVGTALLWGPERIDRVVERFEREIDQLGREYKHDRAGMFSSPHPEPIHA